MPQISTNSDIQKLRSIEQYPFKLRIYLPFPQNPQIQIVLFSKISAKTSFLTIQEVEKLANLAVKEFGINPNTAVWIQYDFSQCEYLSAAAFSLVTFDWCYNQASNPRWLAIHKDWYLYWLENVSEYKDQFV